MGNADKQREILELRDTILKEVRDDWKCHDAEPASPAVFDTVHRLERSIELSSSNPEDLVQWTDRIYGSSSDSDTEMTLSATSSSKRRSHAPKSNGASTFTFDDPDSVGATLQKRTREKQRLKGRNHRDQMLENEGLRHWQKQRDAWTGGRLRNAQSEPIVLNYGESSSNDSDLLRDDSSGSQALQSSNDSDGPFDTPSDLPDVIEEVPRAFAIAPSNLMRPPISPSAYPQIYDKVVSKSLIPTIPINLKDVTSSLVQGWKSDGQWPPKPSAPEPKLARRRLRKKETDGMFAEPDSPRHRHFNRGVGVMRRVLGIGSGEAA